MTASVATLKLLLQVCQPSVVLAHCLPCLQGLLSSAGVRAYLNGHLHGAFGKQLHRMHEAGPAGNCCVV